MQTLRKHLQGLQMSKYQIRFTDRRGHGSFEYVDAETVDEAKELAVSKANEYLKQKRHWEMIHEPLWFESAFKPIRVVNVVEIIKTEREMNVSRNGITTREIRPEWITKRSGNKFKLKLSYIQFKFSDGSIDLNEWYALPEVST